MKIPICVDYDNLIELYSIMRLSYLSGDERALMWCRALNDIIYEVMTGSDENKQD